MFKQIEFLTEAKVRPDLKHKNSKKKKQKKENKKKRAMQKTNKKCVIAGSRSGPTGFDARVLQGSLGPSWRLTRTLTQRQLAH